MRIALLTEGGYPYPAGDTWAWCDRLVRGIPDHDIDVYALTPDTSRGAPLQLPPHVRAVRTWPSAEPGPADRGGLRARAVRRRFLGHYRLLAAALTMRPAADLADRFSSGLRGLAALALDTGALPALLRSETAVRALEAACHAPGADPLVAGARVRDLLVAAGALERALRPLSAPWYAPDALAAADLCHATAGGTTALPGVVAARLWGTPLLLTEYAVRLREHYLGGDAVGLPPCARAVAAAFHRLLAAEAYRTAALITPGNAHIRRWQERCGADPAKIRTVHPGMAAGRLAAIGEAAESADPGRPGDEEPTLVWVGRVEPAKDVAGLLHAFAAVRDEHPAARLRLVSRGGDDPGYLAHCRTLAARLLPDQAADTPAPGGGPVSFEETGAPGAATTADAYAAAGIVVLSSAVEGFPVTLVEAMLCGRATVSTDVGAVREVIGGTGLIVPPGDPRAFAEACAQLLRDPRRRARLGAAARARALELFTAEQNTAAFRGIYRDLAAQRAPRALPLTPVPFARPPEAHLPGRRAAAPATPSWARARTAAAAPTGEPTGERVRRA